MPPLWWWPVMALLLAFLWALLTDRLQWLGFDSWERVDFDLSHFEHYSRLRRQGLSYHEAWDEIERMWEEHNTGKESA